MDETSLEMLFFSLFRMLLFTERLKAFPSLRVLQGRTLRKELQLAVVNSEYPACHFYRTYYDDTFLYRQEIPCVEANLQILAVCFMEKVCLCILLFFHNLSRIFFSSFLAPFSCCHLLFTPLDEALTEPTTRTKEKSVCRYLIF